MRRGVAGVLLAGMVVLGGCAGIRAVTVGADLCRPLPEPDPMSNLDTARWQRRDLLVAALGAHLAKQGAATPGEALQGLAPCLTVESVPGAGGAVAVANLELRYYVTGGVLVYWDGKAWRTWPLDRSGHLNGVIPVPEAAVGSAGCRSTGSGNRCGGSGRAPTSQLPTAACRWTARFSGGVRGIAS